MMRNNIEKNILTGLLNSGACRAATVINSMLNEHVEISFDCECADESESEAKSEAVSAVRLMFRGSFAGTASVCFDNNHASSLVSFVIGKTGDISDLNSIKVGTLTEAGSIILNGVMESLGKRLDCRIDYSVPTHIEGNYDSIMRTMQGNDNTIINSKMLISSPEYNCSGGFIMSLRNESYEKLINAVESGVYSQSE